MRLRTILIVVVVVLVGLVATAVGILMSIDFNQYKPQIAAAVKSAIAPTVSPAWTFLTPRLHSAKLFGPTGASAI